MLTAITETTHYTSQDDAEEYIGNWKIADDISMSWTRPLFWDTYAYTYDSEAAANHYVAVGQWKRWYQNPRTRFLAAACFGTGVLGGVIGYLIGRR